MLKYFAIGGCDLRLECQIQFLATDTDIQRLT